MATQPTNLPVPSESPRDLKFNAGKIDEFVTSLAQQYTDRFGNAHYTIEGLKQLTLQQIYNLGWSLKGTFQGGGTVTAAGDLLQDTSTGIWYRWDDLSSLPKTVPAGSMPSSSGGTGPGKWQPVDVADVLRKDLAKPSGAGLSGYDATVSYPANTVGAELNNRRKNMVFATADAGIPNDGSDVSTQVSTFLNANKGKFIIFDSGTYMFAGVELTGSGWEGTTIYFKGKHLLKPNTDGSNNKWGSWNGIIISSTVNDLTLYYRGDGNRSLQYDREHIFSVVIAGSSNIKIPYFECNEIRGDGCYINRADPLTAGTQRPSNINFGTVVGRNVVKDGRNLISVVSCEIGGVDTFHSENIGGTVGGVLQPGGLDIEPNAGSDFLVRSFVVKRATVINAGTVGIGFQADPTANPKQIRDCHILSATIRSGGTPTVVGAQDCSINFTANTLSGNGVVADGALRCKVTGVIDGCENGALIGSRVAVYDCEFNIKAGNIRNSGTITSWAERCTFNLHCVAFQTSGGGNLIGLWFRDINNIGTAVQRDNTYKINCTSTSGAAFAMQYTTGTNPVITFLGINTLTDSCFTGLSSYSAVTGNVGQYIAKEGKMSGLTYSPGIPTSGQWKAGDFVYYSNPSTTNKFFGFYRITTGSGNVNGTDWGTVSFT